MLLAAFSRAAEPLPSCTKKKTKNFGSRSYGEVNPRMSFVLAGGHRANLSNFSRHFCLVDVQRQLVAWPCWAGRRCFSERSIRVSCVVIVKVVRARRRKPQQVASETPPRSSYISFRCFVLLAFFPALGREPVGAVGTIFWLKAGVLVGDRLCSWWGVSESLGLRLAQSNARSACIGCLIVHAE